jgi:hypothetical protein
MEGEFRRSQAVPILICIVDARNVHPRGPEGRRMSANINGCHDDTNDTNDIFLKRAIK